ncbi:DUF4181 domain-containing protein [Metabacillus arenae]|uniref:DUF4181 domain-containing protein n=1 Tax=Metabacillus arenae TaxID=2771434 RepID=A0A926NTG2_9BACI|nr:DUF4181 domain-containing protein [Metabacillus arenae]MBD1383622.1 DUF4181 domain-containing protein [Metabacillus arenae]
MNQYIFSVIILLVFVVIHIIMKNILNIKKKNGYTHVNKIHKRLEQVLIVLALVLLFLIGFVFNYRLEPHYFVGIISILFAFRAFMEWKFEKVSRQYILSILATSALLVIFIGIELFFI